MHYERRLPTDFVSGTNFLKQWTPLSDERREGGSGDEEHTPHLRTHLEEPSHLQLHRENVSYAKGSGVVSLIWAIIEYWLNSSINVILWQFSLANIWFRSFVRLTNIGHGISIEAMFFAFSRRLRSYESHLSTVALSNVESSRTVSQILFEMAPSDSDARWRRIKDNCPPPQWRGGHAAARRIRRKY